MKKRVLPIVVVLVVMMAITTYATAESLGAEVEPRIPKVISSLSFSGTTANCQTSIRSASDDIVAYMELWKGSTLVSEWTATGNGTVTMNKTCSVSKGATYTLKVYGTIDGEPFSATPLSRPCT